MGISKMGDQKILVAVLNLLLALTTLLGAHAQQCGSQAGGALCEDGLCCSEWGYCGSDDQYCGAGCQSQCDGSGGGGGGGGGGGATPSSSGGDGVGSIITQAIFDEMLKHRNDDVCPGKNFYNYDTFIAVANSFNGFGTTGDSDTRKREIAAFLAQTSHETTGGSPNAPDGPYSWGYCFVQEQGNPGDYCTPRADGPCAQWPCAQGKKYYGRGPIQISTNCNYGQAGEGIHEDLLINPDLVAKDATISFKTAIWFWMTPQSPKPSCHSVMVGQWSPSGDDAAAGRQPGYGMVTNIINGGIECGHGSDSKAADRIGFYQRYCDLLGVSSGSNLDCDSQRPFA